MNSPYRHPSWRKLRIAVLRRDGYLCQIRGPRCKIHATDVDHIVDWQDGGAAFDPGNLRAACRTCNVGQRNHRVAARARAHRASTQQRQW